MKSEEVVRGYKFVGKDMGSSTYTYNKKTGDYDLPYIWKLGRWKKHSGKLKLCASGFHASNTIREVLQFAHLGNRLFMVEAKGRIMPGDSKFVATQMRLVKEAKNLDKIALVFTIALIRRRFYKDNTKAGEIARKAIKAAEVLLKTNTERNLRNLKKIEEEIKTPNKVDNEAYSYLCWLIEFGNAGCLKKTRENNKKYNALERLSRVMSVSSKQIAERETEKLIGNQRRILSSCFTDDIIEALENKEYESQCLLLTSIIEKSMRGEL